MRPAGLEINRRTGISCSCSHFDLIFRLASDDEWNPKARRLLDASIATIHIRLSISKNSIAYRGVQLPIPRTTGFGAARR